MANAIEKLNTIAITDIEKVNTLTDDNIEKLNTLEFTGVTDAHTLISTHDIASLGASASIDITSGIDSTYDVYEFHFTNIHPETGGEYFQFQVNAAGGSGFNETMTTTYFRAVHNESDSSATVLYDSGHDQAEGTAYQRIATWVGADNDEHMSGVLTLYAPSSTTYVKHFTARMVYNQHSDYAFDGYIAGYINTTSAIDEISFMFSTDNIDAGVIKMYGLATS